MDQAVKVSETFLSWGMHLKRDIGSNVPMLAVTTSWGNESEVSRLTRSSISLFCVFLFMFEFFAFFGLLVIRYGCTDLYISNAVD